MILQQKVPSGTADDNYIVDAIPKLDEYIRKGWSIPNTWDIMGHTGSMPMLTSTFIQTIWGPLYKTEDFRKIVVELQKWMVSQTKLDIPKTIDNKAGSELFIEPNAPVNRHLDTFDSVSFNEVHRAILQCFSSKDHPISIGQYYCLKEDIIVFITGVTPYPHFDRSKTIQNLYNFVVYKKTNPIGYVKSCGPILVDDTKSYMCIDDCYGGLTLKKCYLSTEENTPCHFWCGSVKEIIPEKNNSLTIYNTLIGYKSLGTLGSVKNYNQISIDNTNTIYILSNAFSITKDTLINVEFTKFLNSSIIEGSLSQQEFLYSNIDRLFDPNNTIMIELDAKIMVNSMLSRCISSNSDTYNSDTYNSDGIKVHPLEPIYIIDNIRWSRCNVPTENGMTKDVVGFIKTDPKKNHWTMVSRLDGGLMCCEWTKSYKSIEDLKNFVESIHLGEFTSYLDSAKQYANKTYNLSL